MKKLKNRGFLSQQAAELAKTFVKGIQKSHGFFVRSGTFSNAIALITSDPEVVRPLLAIVRHELMSIRDLLDPIG